MKIKVYFVDKTTKTYKWLGTYQGLLDCLERGVLEITTKEKGKEKTVIIPREQIRKIEVIE